MKTVTSEGRGLMETSKGQYESHLESRRISGLNAILSKKSLHVKAEMKQSKVSLHGEIKERDSPLRKREKEPPKMPLEALETANISIAEENENAGEQTK